ncbi:hypothetical protein CPB85DRAFT_1301373 [Mucidula mucida]|nr:hypothetical protein CPB85DRAFT_1301373 [Mucidula mucida]
MSTNSSEGPVVGNPYAPQEPPELISFEKSDFIGMHLADMLYGITVLLFVRCMIGLLFPKAPRVRNIPLAVYVSVLFALGTVFMAMNLNVAVLSFIDNRNFPGGPEVWAQAEAYKAIIVVPNTVFILANWMADALLLYRCKVVWDSHYWVLSLPGLMYLGSISMGIMTIFQSSKPNAGIWNSVTIDFALPYFSLSTSLNVLLTLLISSRLFVHQMWIRKNVGSMRLPYGSIIALLVESSAIYAVSSLLFIGCYGAGSLVSAVFLPILSQTQVIAPLLIISRVINQKAWTSSTRHAILSNPVFQDASQATTQINSHALRSPGSTVFNVGKESNSIRSVV